MITTCELCGASAPTHPVLLRGNLAILVVRWVTRIEGALCSRCIEEGALRMSTINMVGFGGVISMFVTPYYAVANWRQLRRARTALGQRASIDRKSVRRKAARDALLGVTGMFGSKGKAAGQNAVARLEDAWRARQLPHARARELPSADHREQRP